MLPSVSPAIADELTDAGASTISELAYIDPVKVAGLAGLDFIVTTEYIGQALLARYVGKQIQQLRVLGLGGAQEVHNLCCELADDDNARATATLEAAASVLGIEQAVCRRMFEEVAEDPCTVFLTSVWNSFASRASEK